MNAVTDSELVEQDIRQKEALELVPKLSSYDTTDIVKALSIKIPYSKFNVLMLCVQDSNKRMTRFMDYTHGANSTVRLKECRNNATFVEKEMVFQQNLLSSLIEKTVGLMEHPDVQAARLSGGRFYISYVHPEWREICLSIGTTLADGTFERHLDIFVHD